jgi:GABA(A) receptor-associated protein
MSKQTNSYETRQKFASMSLQKKLNENANLSKRYPSKIPVIIYTRNKNISEPEKCKFLIDKNVSIAEFLTVLRKYVKLDPTESIYLFTEDNSIPPSSHLMSQVFDAHKNEDNFLYLEYTLESTFG